MKKAYFILFILIVSGLMIFQGCSDDAPTSPGEPENTATFTSTAAESDPTVTLTSTAAEPEPTITLTSTATEPEPTITLTSTATEPEPTATATVTLTATAALNYRIQRIDLKDSSGVITNYISYIYSGSNDLEIRRDLYDTDDLLQTYTEVAYSSGLKTQEDLYMPGDPDDIYLSYTAYTYTGTELTRTDSYDMQPSETFTGYSLYTNNAQGDPERVDNYNDLGELIGYNLYTYTADNALEKVESFDESDVLTSYTLYTYHDTEDYLIKTETYDSGDTLMNSAEYVQETY
ncbi:MAG: hypothetical protein ACOC4H_01125 [bacterium]